MDPRHQSFKQALLNELINTINDHVRGDVDKVVESEVVLVHLREICKLIYSYFGMNVDVEAILSKKNLLSIDAVMLPLATDPEAKKVLSEEDFLQLIEQLTRLQNHFPLIVADRVLDERMRAVLAGK